ncbi:hypothetical protein HMI55_000510 [Coelomomyces lativittatus]|nr:hypothetical protein HMI55_000510 [Coelomomyces lativittatus]
MLPWPYSIFLSLLSLFRRFYLSHTKTLLQSPSMYFLILRHMFTLLGTTVSSTWLPHILPHFTRFFQWLIQTSPPTVFQMHLLQHVLIHVLSLNTPFFNVFQPTLLPFFSLNPSSSFFHTLLSQLPTQQSKDRCKQILTEFEKYHHYRGKV